MSDNEILRTEIASLGEFGLIDRLTGGFSLQQKSSIKGVGDDAAVLDHDGLATLVSTDMLLEGVHFDLMYMPLKHLGYKSVVVNLSDIYAMNGRPTQITVSIAISNRFSVEAVAEIYEGIAAACEYYQVDLVGGDTTSSPRGLVLSLTAIGHAEKKKIVYRSGAKPGQVFCVSGDLGAAYVGLQLLEREKKIFLETQGVQPDLEDQKYLVSRQLKPEARKDVIELLDRMGIVPGAMIDVSDGLSSELMHICRQSQVGCLIREKDVPIDQETYHKALDFNIDPIICALNGGEDYELLFSLDKEAAERLPEECDIKIIGEVTEKSEGCILETKGGNRHELKAQGWNHMQQ